MVEIPFAEGAPPDVLQVESVGDDVLIGDPENERILKQTFVSNYQHGNIDKALNIAEKIEEKNINFSLASHSFF